MAWAFGQRVGSPMAKLVLVSLADHHNDETGADPFPAIETIAAETEMNERSVRWHLEALEAAGLIARRARGRGKVYRLSLPPKPDTESGKAPSSPPNDTGLCAPLDAQAAGYELILSFPAEHRQTRITQR